MCNGVLILDRKTVRLNVLCLPKVHLSKNFKILIVASRQVLEQKFSQARCQIRLSLRVNNFTFLGKTETGQILENP